MKTRVLVTIQFPHEHLGALPDFAEIVMSTHDLDAMPRQEVLAAIGDCEAVISQGELRADDEFLQAAPKLKIVANAALGYDNLNLDAISARGVWASNSPDAFIESTADLTLALMLAVTRCLTEGDRYARSLQWESDGIQPVRWEGRQLSALTLGLVGYGRIAKSVEKRARAFDMPVLFTRTREDPSENYRSFDQLLAESDIISIHTPLTPETRHLFNAATFARMKPGAILINLSRGKVVDEAALVAALQCGHLGGAGLDVFEHEPRITPALTKLPTVVLTPHLGGSTVEDRRRGRLQAAENVLHVLRGKRPPNALNEAH